MRTKILLILVSITLCSFAEERKDTVGTIEGSITSLSRINDSIYNDIAALLLTDYLYHFGFTIGEDFYHFDNEKFSLRYGLSVMPMRLFASVSTGVSYRTERLQIYTGPSLACDMLYGPMRIMVVELLDAAVNGRGFQDYWLYLGLETGLNIDVGENWGISLKSRNSIWNITSLYKSEKSKYSNRYDFVSLGLFFRG